MNFKEYIASGILEAYVLDELTSQQRNEVEQNLAHFPELVEELKKIEEVQMQLMLRMAVAPPARVKASLFEKVDNQVSNNVTPITQTNRIWQFAAAASLILALVASYLAYNYYNNWQHAAGSLSELIAQNQRVAEDYNRVNQRIEQIEHDLSIIDNPSFRRVVMQGTANAPDAMAYVYWNQDTEEVYLSLQNMKALAHEQQYQLWAIVDGKPVDAGVFDSIATGLLKMKNLGGAAAFAVTIEPRGGKPTPSLETMQVIGNVKS